jgi:hypothetical protein
MNGKVLVSFLIVILATDFQKSFSQKMHQIIDRSGLCRAK